MNTISSTNEFYSGIYTIFAPFKNHDGLIWSIAKLCAK